MSEKQSPAEALPRIREIISSGGSCRLVVTGSSMQPFLRSGRDAVILSPVTLPFRRGDIIFYERVCGQCILHRVVGSRPDGTLLLCGDAQTGLEPLDKEHVIAAASQIERSGRLFSADAPVWRALSLLWLALRPIRARLSGFKKNNR